DARSFWRPWHRGSKIVDHRCHNGGHIVQGVLEQGAFFLELTVAPLRSNPLTSPRRKITKRAALILDDLTEEQILCLNRSGALVEGVDLGVTDVLLNRIGSQKARDTRRLERLG